MFTFWTPASVLVVSASVRMSHKQHFNHIRKMKRLTYKIHYLNFRLNYFAFGADRFMHAFEIRDFSAQLYLQAVH